MKVTVHYAGKAAPEDIEGVEVQIDIELPYVPGIGWHLKVTPNGDYLEVDNVYLDTAGEDRKVDVWLQQQRLGLPDLGSLLDEGWEISAQGGQS